jgi:citrate synthase
LKSAERPTTAIAWAFPDRVIVRDEDLCSSLIGHLSLTEYFHFLLLGRRPDPQQRLLLDACFVALAEHGLVPSVQAARMTLAAAPEAWQGAVAAGLLGCGSVILGSSEIAGRMLAEIVSEAKATNVSLGETAALRVAALRKERIPLPGFGHPLHREEDPRATRLLSLADELGTAGDHVAAMRAVAQATTSVYGRPLVLNVSGAIPAVLLDVGFPLLALKGVPLVGRTVSLIAHLLEESSHPIGFALAHAAEAAVEFTGDSAPANFTERNA